MRNNTKTPNKKIRTILLGILLVMYLSTIIYVCITKENHNLSGTGRSTTVVEEDKYGDDYYEDNYDDYDDYDYYDNEQDGELNVNSSAVISLYNYVKLYPYVSDIPTTFKVTDLTEEQKMRLVAASLKSKNIATSEPVADALEQEITLNNKTYKAVTPNIRYKRYTVTDMYDEIFGTTTTLDFTTIMYDGDDIAYKYDDSAYGYVKYVYQSTEVSQTSTSTEVVRAVKTNGNIELYIKTGTQTEKYIFAPKEGYKYIYRFVERASTQSKNSL